MPIDGRSEYSFRCPFCGPFQMRDETADDLEGCKARHDQSVPYLPHAIRRLSRENALGPVLNLGFLEERLKHPLKPTPQEQADNLIRWLGDNRTDIGRDITVSHETIGPMIGTISIDEMFFILKSLDDQGLLNCHFMLGPQQLVRLSFLGWQRFEELKKGTVSENIAFMAMQYGEADLDRAVAECFRPALADTGYELRQLNDPDRQRAGLIDDRMRIEIKQSRFILADLTHNNNGAYWEAGFAEGLGKPVIYTCEKGVFEARQRTGGGTHFDTNHHLHILWSLSDLPQAARDLKACIRVTIPEAKQSD